MGAVLSLLLACAYTFAAAATGWLLAAALGRDTGTRLRTSSILALALIGGAIAWAADPSLLKPNWPRHVSMDDADSAAGADGASDVSSNGSSDGAAVGAFRPFTAGDPSLPGSYAYDAFTYGSGDDRRPRSARKRGSSPRPRTLPPI